MLVSVIIPAFNAAGSIVRAITSITAQTIRAVEIIVIDDGCTDGTAELVIALEREDSRIRLLPSIGNRGVSAARNRGLASARGEWIAVLDADDAFAPDRLERLIADAIAAGADVAADNIAYFDWHAQCQTGVAIRQNGKSGWRLVGSADFFENTITGQSLFDYGQLKPVVLRSFLDCHMIEYVEHVRHGEDFLFLAHLLLAGASMILLQSPLYIYTERTGSISRDRSGMTRTVENCRQMRKDTIELLTHPAVQKSKTLRRLLKRRMQAIQWHQSWEKVYYAVKRRDFPAIGVQAIRDWRIPILLVSKAYEYIRRYRRMPVFGHVQS